MSLPAPLVALGLDEARAAEVEALGGALSDLRRVTRLDRGWATFQGEGPPERLEFTTEPAVVVGDWVLVGAGGLQRLSRRTELARRAGYRRDQRQALAANVDLVLCCRALDTELRVHRVASLVVIAADSGADPVVVLTKADASGDPEAARRAAARALGPVPIHVVSTRTGAGLEELARAVAGRTIVLLGESGAGKSTLTNALVGTDLLETGAVRRDGQGRHTTTSRELVVLPSGGVVIDSPGIREAAAFAGGPGLDRAFADVVALEAQCRFADCAHDGVPGCALDAALRDGSLTEERRQLYLDEAGAQAWIEERLTRRAQRPTGRPRAR